MSAASNAGALAACGILATIPIDAAERDGEVKDPCVAQAREIHKQRTAVCQR